MRNSAPGYKKTHRSFTDLPWWKCQEQLQNSITRSLPPRSADTATNGGYYKTRVGVTEVKLKGKGLCHVAVRLLKCSWFTVSKARLATLSLPCLQACLKYQVPHSLVRSHRLFSGFDFTGFRTGNLMIQSISIRLQSCAKVSCFSFASLRTTYRIDHFYLM